MSFMAALLIQLPHQFHEALGIGVIGATPFGSWDASQDACVLGQPAGASPGGLPYLWGDKSREMMQSWPMWPQPWLTKSHRAARSARACARAAQHRPLQARQPDRQDHG
eukprot:355368-Chlamydomonas_euryale.AAC.1